MKPVGVAFAQMDLDATPMERKLKRLNETLTDGTIKVENAYRSLGIKSDQVYNIMKANATAAVDFIKNRTLSSTEEIYAAEKAAAAKIQAINAKQFAMQRDLQAQRVATAKAANDAIAADWSRLGMRSTQTIKAEQAEVEAAYLRRKAAAQGNANELLNIEAAKSAKMLALNKELHATALANKATETARLKAEAEAQAVAAEKPWKVLGIRSTEAIKNEMAQIKAAAIEKQAIYAKGSQDWVRIEKAKNSQLKALNREMTGDHEMSMAAMTRAVLKFYAAYYVISNVFRVVKDQIMEGVKAIDDMKIASISVAAQITSMQGTTGDVTENYRKNLEYAKALVPVLMEIDAASFANYSQVQKMNMAMTNQGIILDINNKKQIEAFTALTNAVALFTGDQNKEKQAMQEIRSLMAGRVRDGDMVSLQMDALIKKQGEYKGGLKELVEEGKKHGDTLERMLPYLNGIIAASGDIGQTWEAVSSSFETAWIILQRGFFKNIYKDLTEQGQKAAQYMKDNADDIVKSLENIKNAMKFAGATVIGTLLAMKVATISWGTVTGSTLTWLSTQWKSYGLLVSREGAKAVSSMNKIGVAAGVMTAAFAGWSIGTWLSDEFEWARKAGVYMVYGIADMWAEFILDLKLGWEDLKSIAAGAKALFTKDTIADVKDRTKIRMDAIQAEYDKEKAIRDQYRKEQLKDVTDAAIEAAKAKAEASKPTAPDVGLGQDDFEESYRDRTKVLQAHKREIKAYYDDAIKQAESFAKANQRAGQDERQTITALYDAKNKALEEYKNKQYELAERETELEKMSADNAEKTFDNEEVLQSKLLAINADYNRQKNQNDADRQSAIEDYADQHLSTMAGLYSTISQYSDESIAYQLRLLEEEYIQKGRYAEGSLALAMALKVAEEKLWQDADNFWMNYYGSIAGYENVYYQKKLDWIEKVRQAEIAAANAGKKTEAEKVMEINAANDKAMQAKRDTFSETIDLIGKNYDAEHEYQSESIKNAIAVFDNASSLMDEESKEYRLMQDAKKAMQIAELAMTIQKNVAVLASIAAIQTAKEGEAVVSGVGAILTQGSGDPYSAFARIAAMTAIVSSVLAMAGIAFGGSGAGSAATTSTLPKSTVLGAAAGTGSESLYNSFELLEDTYDMQYSELSELNKSMRDLNNNISGLVANILQYGMGDVTNGVVEGTVRSSLLKSIDNIIYGGMGRENINQLYKLKLDPLTNYSLKLASGIAAKIFGGKTTTDIQETGLAMRPGSVSSMISGLGIDAQTYALIKTIKDGGWFKDDKTSYTTQYDDIAASTEDLLGSIYQDISSTLVYLTEEFGTDMSKTLGYTFESIKLNLKDMDAEEINETLQNYFSGIGDTAVEALFGTLLRGYQEVGEGLMETAVRLVRDKAVITNVLEKTNQEFIGSIENIIAFSEELIKLAGGLDALQDSFETYYKSFIPESERMANTYKDISSVLGDLNMALPETRDGYRDLVESLDLSFKEVTSVVSSSSGTASAVSNTASQLKSLGMALTAAIAAGDVAKIQQYQAAMNVLMNNMNNAANQTATTIGTTTTVITKGQQEQYAALLLYAEYADAYYSYIEEIEAKRASMQIELLEAQGKSEEALALRRQMELDAMDESLRALQEEIWATEELSKAMEEVANRSETVSDWLNSLITSSVIPVTSAEAYQEQYDKLYAESGTAEGLSDFLNYATQYLNFMKSYSGDYLDIYNKVIRDVSVLDPEYVSPQQAFVNDFLANPANYGGVDRENILGSYASGTDYVPKTGPYILHQGEKVTRASDNSSDDNKKIIQILSSLVSSAQPIVIPLDGKVIAKSVGKYIPITPELTDAIRRVQ